MASGYKFNELKACEWIKSEQETTKLIRDTKSEQIWKHISAENFFLLKLESHFDFR